MTRNALDQALVWNTHTTAHPYQCQIAPIAYTYVRIPQIPELFILRKAVLLG